MNIEQVKLDALIPYARNSRTHSDAQVAQIAASIKEFGFTNPVLIDETGSIIAGHGRVMASRKLALADVPCIRLSHLTAAQKRAYIIADNKLALNAGWDDEMLRLELSDLKGLDFNLDLTGFSTDEINQLLTPEQVEGLTDEDAVPEIPVDPVTKLGDVWLLGKHRVMCGDSTSIDAVEKLMDGQKADLVFTDPPYGMKFGGGASAGSTPKGALVKAHGMIMGDDKTGDDLIALVQNALTSATVVLKSGASIYVCFTWRTYSEFYKALVDIGLKPASCIVWDKKSVGLGFANYRPQHEFIFYIKGDGWYGDNAQSDVWYGSRGAVIKYVHPTQKPVELIEKAINNSSKGGDTILDLFGGSGSTLIACEKTGRINRSMELDPKYCDVIVQRWQEFTGQTATLESNGKPFIPVKKAA